MMLRLSLFVLGILTLHSGAQTFKKQGFSCTGSNVRIGDLHISSTIGQPALVGSTAKENIYLSQGFQHESSFRTFHEPKVLSFQLYPNPAHGSTRLLVEDHPISKVALLTTTGKTFYKNLDVNGLLNLTGIRAGVYLVQIQVSGQWMNLTKLVVLQ